VSAGAIEGNQGPAYDAVLQTETAELPAIAVTVAGTVAVQPAQAAGGLALGRLITATNVAAVKLLNADPARGETTLIGGADFCVGYSKDVAEGRQAVWPGKVPLHIRNGEQVWVCSPVGGTDTYVTAISDQWTK
jgi:hypothetical protein